MDRCRHRILATSLEELALTGRVVMSVSGRDVEGCVEVCKELDRYPGWVYLEINVSCAHSNDVHGMITRNSQHIHTLVSSIKDAGVNTPIVIKLGHSDIIVPMAQVAKDAGADALVLLNTYGPLLDFDIGTHGSPNAVLGIQGAKGGMSGYPLFNIAMTDVAEVIRQVSIPIIACGGVSTAEQVVKMIMVGAMAVQVYTAAHVRGVKAPSIFSDLNSKLITLMDKKNISTLDSVRGAALSILEQSTALAVDIPTVNAPACTGCGLCVDICIPQAISFVDAVGINNLARVVQINSACVACGHCIAVCPAPLALRMRDRRS